MSDIVFQKDESIKKGKMMFLSLFIVLFFVGNRVFGPFHEFFLNPIFLSFFYGIISILGFAWVLVFKLNLRIIFIILPHLALIIFSQMFFIQMFFQSSFARMYETLLMFIMLILIFIFTYVTFLTFNVFAVSTFKKIPLEAVAKTSLYFLSVLSIFFFTYGFLSLDVYLINLILIIFFIYFILILLLFTYFFIDFGSIIRNSTAVFWNILLIFSGSILFASRIEFVAFLVALVFYFCVDLFIERRENMSSSRLYQYFFILFLAILISFYF